MIAVLLITPLGAKPSIGGSGGEVYLAQLPQLRRQYWCAEIAREGPGVPADARYDP
jgi:hypothetical protein